MRVSTVGRCSTRIVASHFALYCCYAGYAKCQPQGSYKLGSFMRVSTVLQIAQGIWVGKLTGLGNQFVGLSTGDSLLRLKGLLLTMSLQETSYPIMLFSRRFLIVENNSFRVFAAGMQSQKKHNKYLGVLNTNSFP